MLRVHFEHEIGVLCMVFLWHDLWECRTRSEGIVLKWVDSVTVLTVSCDHICSNCGQWTELQGSNLCYSAESNAAARECHLRACAFSQEPNRMQLRLMAKPLPHSPWLLLCALVQTYHSSMHVRVCLYERLHFTVNCIAQIVSGSYLMQFETAINQLI